MTFKLNFRDFLKVSLTSGCYWGVNGSLNLLRRLLFRDLRDPGKILIFRTGSIGDNICAIPAIVAIRTHFVQAEIHILTTAGVKSPISMARLLSEDYYNKLIDYQGYKWLDLYHLVKRNEYHLIIELPQNMTGMVTMVRNMFFFRFAGIRSGWGWEVATLTLFKRTQERLTHFSSERNRLISILQRNGIKSNGDLIYPLRITADDVRCVNQLLQERILTGLDRKHLVAIVPGAKRPQNRYPIERFVEMAKWLVRRGYYVIVIGGPDDGERGKMIESVDGAYSFVGKCTPIQSAALLSRCRIAVSNDTGPMHLSYAVGTPVLALFSSRDFPHKWFPPEGNRVLRNNNIHCSLCLSETCADNICMKGISLDQVKLAFEELEQLTA